MRIGFIGARVVAQLISKPVRAVDHQGAVEQHRGPDSLAPLVRELRSGVEA